MCANRTSGLPATVTIVRSTKGDLNKSIRLDPDGEVHKSHPAPMSEGWAVYHPEASNAEALAGILRGMQKDTALILGELKDKQSYAFPVLSKRKALNHFGPRVVRSKEFFHFPPGQQTWVLLDHDTKDTPEHVKANVGDWRQAALKLWPELAIADMLETSSSSSHICRPDGTLVQDAASHRYVRFYQEGLSQKALLEDLLLRGWLHGFSFWIIGKAGQLLERGLFDAAVGSPERLSFEAPPTLESGLSRAAPPPIVIPGECIGYEVLHAVRRKEALALRSAAKDALREQAASVRAEWQHNRALHIAASRGISYEQALATVRGVFLAKPNLIGLYEVQLSDGAFVTVNDILEDPYKYHMIDGPSILDGPDYGWSRIQIMTLTTDGKPLRQPFIIDFAHGQNVRYNLVHTSNVPSVKLNRPALFSTERSMPRAETWTEQERRLIARNAYQLREHQFRWRVEWTKFLESYRNKPSPPKLPCLPFKMPKPLPPLKVGACDCMKTRYEGKLKEWEDYEEGRVEPVWWDASQTGIGKSHVRNDFLRWVTSDQYSGWDRNRHGVFVVVLERHKQIDTALAELEGLNVVAVRGRGQLCAFPDQIKQFSGLVRSVSRDVCKHCPFYESCEYFQQFNEAKQADIVVIPRELAYQNPVEIVGRRVACWLFDEDQTSILLEDPIEITKSDLMLHHLKDVLSARIRDVVTLPEVSAALQHLHDNIKWSEQGGIIEVPFNLSLVEALDMLSDGEPSLEMDRFSDPDAFRTAMDAKLEVERAGVAWCKRIKALLSAITNGRVLGAYIGRTKPVGLAMPQACIVMYRRKDISGIKGCRKAPRVLYSATAESYWNRQGLDFGDPDKDDIPLPVYVRVRLMDSHTGSASSLLEDCEPTSLLLRLVNHFNSMGGGLWVSQISVEAAVADRLCQGSLTMHYGATTSRNDAEGVRYTMSVGRPLPPPVVYEAMVEALTGDYVSRLPPGAYWPLAEGWVRCSASHLLQTEVYSHRSPAVQDFMRYQLKTQIVQAIGRPRAIRAEGPMTIDIFGKVPTGYNVDQIGSLSDFEAGPLALICHTGMVPLTTEAENKLASALFPHIYRDAQHVQEARKYEATKASRSENIRRIHKTAGAGDHLTLSGPAQWSIPQYGPTYTVPIPGHTRGAPVGFPVGFAKNECEQLVSDLLGVTGLRRYQVRVPS